MNNWERQKNRMRQWGLKTVDNVPENIMKYLNENVTDDKWNARLAGHIKEEYRYKNWPSFVEQFILSQTNDEVLSNWLKKHSVLSSDKPFYLSNLWCNFQKKHEFNPIHDHSGLFSFIIFLKIPYDLKDEDKVFPTNSTGGSLASRLAFIFNDTMGDLYDLNIDVDKTFEGKMIMFPARLYHLVYPFYTSDDYRITVSGNINFWVE